MERGEGDSTGSSCMALIERLLCCAGEEIDTHQDSDLSKYTQLVCGRLRTRIQVNCIPSGALIWNYLCYLGILFACLLAFAV